MALVPGNPVVGGTVLRRAAIQSPNYVLGVSGWAIRQDGTAQFTSVVVIGSGGVITGGIIRTAASAPLVQLDGPHDALLVYDASGNLIATVTPAAGNDGLGNAFVAGIASYSTSKIAQLFSGGLLMSLLGATPTVLVSSVAPALDGSGLALNIASGTVGSDIQALLLLGDSASAHPGLQVIDPLDGNTYQTQHKTFIAAGQPVNSTTPAPVTGITGISVAKRTYLIRGMIIVTQGATTASQAIRVAGPAITSMNIAWNCIEAGSVLSSGVQTALNADLSTGAVPTPTTGELHFDGQITFSAAGSTFGLTAREITNGDPWTLGAGSYLELIPV